MNDTATAEYVDDERPEVTGGVWRCEDLADVDWCLKRIGEFQQEAEEVETIRRKRIEEINAKAALLVARAQRAATFFESRIRDYAFHHREELLKGGQTKTRNLLHGAVSWRKVGGKPKVIDRDALLAWARRQADSGAPVFLRISDEPAWDEIKKHVAATGEVPPGVEVAAEEEELQVKVGGKKQ